MNVAYSKAHNMPALKVRALTAGYEDRSVLTKIDLEVPGGQWFALLGPNGSGKTTLLTCAVGMLEPSEGDVLICGHSIRSEPSAAKRLLGFACAPESIPGLLTGHECLQIFAAAKDLRSVDEDVNELADILELSTRLSHRVQGYSLGMRQKLAILLALLGEPKLIVLDESFNGLDPQSALILRKYFRTRVSSGRSSVVLATHSLDTVERYADRAALLLDGSLIHEWDAMEIARLRQSDEGLEAAVAEVCRRHRISDDRDHAADAPAVRTGVPLRS
jgi:ABC-2 type transport system ATP-binding protein